MVTKNRKSQGKDKIKGKYGGGSTLLEFPLISGPQKIILWRVSRLIYINIDQS